MKVQTTRFGEVEVQDDLVFNFVSPILGYENLKLFAVIDNNSESPFKWLQSLENPELAFPISVPGYFGLDYQFNLPEEDVKRLEITDSNEILTLNIVNIPNDRPQDSTINLAGPLIINIENRKAMQLILPDISFSARQRLFDENASGSAPYAV